MKTFKIRPYFGNDCNSHDGFNNGHYLDEIKIQALDEQDAIDKAIDQFVDEHSEFRTWERDSHLGENTLYFEFDHVNKDGNSIEPDDMDDNSAYLYQYVDFNEVERNEK